MSQRDRRQGWESKPKLTSEQTNYIICLMSLQPELTTPQLVAYVQEKFGITASENQLSYIRTRRKDQIAELRQQESKALSQALAVGDLPYVSVLHRVRKLSEVADMGIDGYLEQVADPRNGNIISLRKRNSSASVAAIKSITELVDRYQELGNPELPFTLNIGLAKPQVDISDNKVEGQ